MQQGTLVQRVGLLGLLGTTVVLLLGQALHVYYGSQSEGPRDGWVQVLPWVAVAAMLAVALFVGPRLRLGLIAASVVILLKLALPYVVTMLPGQDNPHPIWIDVMGSPDVEWLESIADRSAFAIWAGDLLLWFGALLVLAFTIVTVIGLKDLLLSRASTASFSIDMTVLLVVFFFVSLASVGAVVFGEFLSSVGDLATMSTLWLQLRVLVWLLPLVLWLAFTGRQGGVIALGSASGLVGAFLIIPAVMDLVVQQVFDGSSGRLVYSDGFFSEASSAYQLLDGIGYLPAVAAVAVLMFIIALWWGLGTHSGGNPARTLGTTSSPVNTLSVVAFVLAWFPFTAIPAVVLGHMAYDQVVDGNSAQRGIGLSRWAIVIGYISAIAALALSYNIWFA